MKLLKLIALGIVGGGGLPAISISPSSWDAGSTPVGTPVSQVFTIENTGSSALVITLPITMAGDDPTAFTVTVQPTETEPGLVTLAPGASTTFTVQADADEISEEGFSADISITNNSSENPKLVAVEVIVEMDYALNDDFTTADANPLTSPRTAEPGPGIGIIVDTGGNASISGGELLFAAGVGWGDPGIEYDNILGAHVGRVLEIQYTFRNASFYQARFGWMTGASAFVDALYIAFSQSSDSFLSWLTTAKALNDAYQMRIVMGIERAYWFVKGDIYTDWQLLGMGRVDAMQANVFAALTDNTARDKYGHIRAWDTNLDTFLSSLALGYSADGSAAIVGAGDGMDSVVWTPQSTEALNLHVRQSDATHRLTIRCDQAGSTIALYQDDAGETLIGASVAQTWTANSTYMISVRRIGTEIVVDVNGTMKLTRTSSFNQAQTGVNVSGGAYVRDLITLPKTYTDDFAVTAAIGVRDSLNILGFGDSKTAGTGGQSYMQFVCRELGALEMPTRMAVGGRSTATWATLIDAALAAASGTPDYILYNMGANDVTALVEATWKTDTAYIWDAMLTKWPSVEIYVARVWRDTYDTECNSMASWIDDLIATRPRVHLGHDERVWMKSSDSGARWTSDGVHPRVQEGYIECAKQWLAVLP